MLGAAASDRGRALCTLEAPDFTLPDIDGNLHSLSDYRGKRVFLTTWSSW
ncbi:MAG: redoxin domain-containing protein [Gammaproteobacteria bacterium]|nr:redoxin domain-containing protein [Gammaproteobacteria bacterium]